MSSHYLQEIYGTFVASFRQLEDASSPLFKRSVQTLSGFSQVCRDTLVSACLAESQATAESMGADALCLPHVGLVQSRDGV